MKINYIEYENFRNFKNKGKINCSTNGKVTIVYGKNGDGKTTLHQLFRWVLSGDVKFNKTTTEKLYNLSYIENLNVNECFDVMGRINFSHLDENYSITRTRHYQKDGLEPIVMGEECRLLKMVDGDWELVQEQEECMNRILPPALYEYFFFDGENMIADLHVKADNSALRLKQALYTMFDLDVVQEAIGHIGNKGSSSNSTVLGKLYMSKGDSSNNAEIVALKAEISHITNTIETIKEKIDTKEKERDKLTDRVNTISEQIGSNKTKADYERERGILKQQEESFHNNNKVMKYDFGEEIFRVYPKLFVSKAVELASEKIHLKIQDNKLPYGLGKMLINYLLDENVTECVCGRKLDENHRKHIEEYLKLLPPYSYGDLYNEFKKTAKNWGEGYNGEKLADLIIRIINNGEQANVCHKKIAELDAQEKASVDIQDLVIERAKEEEQIRSIGNDIAALKGRLNDANRLLSSKMRKYDDGCKVNSKNEIIFKKIQIMEKVLEYFQNRLESYTLEYSKKLEENIQDLINKMLTSRRTVSVTKEFQVSVYDSYGDESKSEGQFAIVTFAYIGGILNMLKNDNHLINKEYPLILDGPFSKLDKDQRQNVIDLLPDFAPQVIIFSKDDLNDYFKEDKLGRVWTITSNEEKNIAQVKEGHLWK